MPASKRFNVRDICLIGMFTAIIVICAQISVPLPGGIPFTLQTFAIALGGIVLGARKGTMAALVYILLGALGVPVFAHFTGGLHFVFGPTGGFILSFPIIAFLAGLAFKNGSTFRQISLITAGISINFICGMLFFSRFSSIGLQAAFMAAVLPFLPMELVRITILVILGKNINKRLASYLRAA